jgi:hypothetical protein
MGLGVMGLGAISVATAYNFLVPPYRVGKQAPLYLGLAQGGFRVALSMPILALVFTLRGGGTASSP